MDALSLLLDGVRIIGWVLLHFLWQAALVGAAYAGIRSLLPRGEWRYRCGMGALIMFALCPVLTGWWLLDTAAAAGQAALDVAPVTVPAFAAAAADGNVSWAAALNTMLPWLVLAWFAGVLLLSLRAWQQWRRLKILVRLAERVPPWQATLNRLAASFGLRRGISVLRSKLVDTPVLVGWLRPVILLPLAVACEFPVAQVELILAHELAHLKRWDPVANLFQVVLETLHFYHPVVHWVSRDVRNEREICSDRLALSVTGGSRQEFAATLAQLGELREQPGSLLLAASGGVLLDRVQYMVLPEARRVRKRAPARLLAVIMGTALIAITLRLEWNQAREQEALASFSSAVPSVIAPLAIAMKIPLIPALDVTATKFLPHFAPLRASLVTPERDDVGARAIDVSLLPAPIATISLKTLPVQPVVLPKAMADVPKVASMASVGSEPTVVSAAGLTPIRVRQPVYPQTALMRGEEGEVVVEFGLADDGTLRDVQVVQSQPAGVFDQAAIHAMQGWKYPAPTVAGMQRRYRQAMMFVVNAALARDHASSGARAGEEIHARADCQILTGTHICRWPGDGAGFVRSPQ
jgi:TonB family protein